MQQYVPAALQDLDYLTMYVWLALLTARLASILLVQDLLESRTMLLAHHAIQDLDYQLLDIACHVSTTAEYAQGHSNKSVYLAHPTST